MAVGAKSIGNIFNKALKDVRNPSYGSNSSNLNDLVARSAGNQKTPDFAKPKGLNDMNVSMIDESNRSFRDVVGDLGRATKNTYKSGVSHFSDAGNRKSAFRGIVKSTAADATLHGGIAAIQGEDPWEAAKSGAFQGAVLGTGYMGLKGSLGVEKKFGRGGFKEMRSNAANMYEKEKRSSMSRPLEAKLRNDQNSQMAKNILGHR